MDFNKNSKDVISKELGVKRFLKSVASAVAVMFLSAGLVGQSEGRLTNEIVSRLPQATAEALSTTDLLTILDTAPESLGDLTENQLIQGNCFLANILANGLVDPLCVIANGDFLGAGAGAVVGVAALIGNARTYVGGVLVGVPAGALGVIAPGAAANVTVNAIAIHANLALAGGGLPPGGVAGGAIGHVSNAILAAANLICAITQCYANVVGTPMAANLNASAGRAAGAYCMGNGNGGTLGGDYITATANLIGLTGAALGTGRNLQLRSAAILVAEYLNAPVAPAAGAIAAAFGAAGVGNPARDLWCHVTERRHIWLAPAGIPAAAADLNFLVWTRAARSGTNGGIPDRHTAFIVPGGGTAGDAFLNILSFAEAASVAGLAGGALTIIATALPTITTSWNNDVATGAGIPLAHGPSLANSGVGVHIRLSAAPGFAAAAGIPRVAAADLSYGNNLTRKIHGTFSAPLVTLEALNTLHEARISYRYLTGPGALGIAGHFLPTLSGGPAASASAPVLPDVLTIWTNGNRISTMFPE